MGWYRAITDERVWDQQLDTPRFRKAFTNLMKNRRQWPSPADFMEAMPPREQLAIAKQPITSAPDSPEMKAVFDELSKVLGVPSRRKAETGHGHVKKRSDGFIAKCGGPDICDECSRERALVVGH